MANSNIETIEIKERMVYAGSKPCKVFELYVDGCKRAAIQQSRNGNIRFYFDPVGAFDWQEAKVWLQGLLELSIHAEELTYAKDKKKK